MRNTRHVQVHDIISGALIAALAAGAAPRSIAAQEASLYQQAVEDRKSVV